MTPWSIVALAAILCTTFTFCWGLWLNAVYLDENKEFTTTYEDDETKVYPSEEVTGTWDKPVTDEPAV